MTTFTPTPARITSFTGPHRFLSNFWPVRIRYLGLGFPTVEHAYQAAKSNSYSEQHAISQLLTPNEAKRHGRKILFPRRDWLDVRLTVMTELVERKFLQCHTDNSDLRIWLRATGDAELIEGNTWGDTFWGQCPIGTGENHLGKILMNVRTRL